MLKDKIVLITGGAGLLGQEYCAAVANNSGKVLVADLDFEAASNIAQKINVDGCSGSAEAVRLDITEPSSVDELITFLDGRYGRVDAIVNNAYPRNKNWGRKLEDVAYTDFCENVNMHLGGYFLMAQRFAGYFKSQGFGNIVNMASVYGMMAPRFELYADTPMTVAVEYAAIKSAIIQLTRYFAQYFKHDGIRCNSISPGGIFDSQPEPFLQRYNSHCGTRGMLNNTDINGTLLFLLADSSKYVTGQNIVVDDGFSL